MACQRHAAGVGAMWSPVRAVGRLAHEVAVEVHRYWARATITFLVGAVVLVLIRIPQVEQSFIGQPDRVMSLSPRAKPF